MTEKSAPFPAMRSKVSTGYGKLDEALRGGFLAGSMVVLNAPASDEVPILLRQFLEVDQAASLLICRTLSAADMITHDSTIKSLVCSDKPVPPAKNVIPGKGVDSLTDVNLVVADALSSVQPKRLVLDIVSDVLLRHKGLQTRRWLTELLERLRAKNITTLAVLNPYMHPSEDVQAVVDLFDGNLEITEEKLEGTPRSFLRTKWMHGVEVTEKDFPLIDIAPEPQPSEEPIAATPLKEPRWRTPLVSRSQELGRLKAAFEDSLRSRGSIVTLRGEAGVGKTRLMQELAVHAQSNGAVVLSGRASGDGLPYNPWVEAGRQYVAQAPGELLRRMLGTDSSELVKLVPDLAAKVGTIPPPKTGSEQQNKSQFYEAVTQFFIAITKGSPLLLLFDDMEKADVPSSELLEYIVRRTSDLRVLTVCSTIPEVDPTGPFEQALLHLNKERLMESVRVELLDEDATASLVKETFGEQTVTPEFADLIYQHTRGNPFFVEEVLRSLVDNGTVFKTETGWERKPIQDIKLPDSVKTALKSRLTRLDAQALSTLDWAAVIGPVFDFEVLREASGVDEEALLKIVETTINEGLILELPNEPGQLSFQDERIRSLLLEDMIQLKRRRYHQKIVEVIEKLCSATLEDHSETIATHAELAGDRERTIKYSIMAGNRNRSIYAYEQAVGSYQRALRLMEGKDGKEPAKSAGILESIGECYVLASQFAKSIEPFKEALGLYEKSNDHQACGRISTSLSWAMYRVKGPEEATHFLEDAVKHVKDNPESSEAAGLYGQLANLLGVMERYDEADQWSHRALQAGEKSGNFAAVSDALQSMAYHLLDSAKIDEGLPLLERSLQVAEQNSLYLPTALALLNLASYTYPRDLSKARDYLSQWLTLAKKENVLYGQASAMVFIAYLDWIRGDWVQALEEYQSAFDIRNRLGFDFRSINAEAHRGRLLIGMGDLERAEESCQLAMERHDEQVHNKVATDLALAKLRLEQGRVNEAETHLAAAVKTFKDHEFTTDPLSHIETLLCLTKLQAEQGHLQDARETADWAKRLAETLKSDPALAMAYEAEASLLLTTGDEKTEAAFLNCLTLWEKAGWPYYHAKATLNYAQSITKTKPEESKKRRQQAAEIFEKLGAKRDLEKTQSTLNQS